MALWEIIFMLVVLKVPLAYVGSVMWWAVKAEPEAGSEGGTEGMNWTPWRQRPPAPARPGRQSARGAQARAGSRAARRSQRRRQVA
jgi:hypothetical protein